MMTWRKMSTAPKDGTSILVRTKRDGFRVVQWIEAYPYLEGACAWSYGEYNAGYCDRHLTCEPTGWQEITN